MMSNGDHEGRIFLSHAHKNNGFFFSVTIKYHIIFSKRPPEYAEMQHVIMSSL